jgi:hypothetical protein
MEDQVLARRYNNIGTQLSNYLFPYFKCRAIEFTIEGHAARQLDLTQLFPTEFFKGVRWRRETTRTKVSAKLGARGWAM